jgi:hypothetical protein
MDVADVRRLKQIEHENAKLKRNNRSPPAAVKSPSAPAQWVWYSPHYRTTSFPSACALNDLRIDCRQIRESQKSGRLSPPARDWFCPERHGHCAHGVEYAITAS